MMESSAPSYNGSRLLFLRPGFLWAGLKLHRARAALTGETTGAVLDEYGLGLLQEPTLPPGGEGRSHSVVVHTADGKKLLKQYKRSITQTAIEQEHSILKYLARVEFASAPRLVTTRRGETIVQRDDRKFALFEFIEGGFQYYKYVLLPHQTRHFIAIAGDALAQLHETLEGFTPTGGNPNGFRSLTGDRWHDLNWYLDRLNESVRCSTAQTHALALRADEFEQTLRALDVRLGECNLPRATTHGDYGPHNLLFRKHAPVVILDFEIARLDWRALDVVNALWNFGRDGRTPLKHSHMEWFLHAYNARLPLTPDERAALPLLWKFSHLRRCIVNWYEYHRTHDEFNLEKAYRHLRLYDWLREPRRFL